MPRFRKKPVVIEAKRVARKYANAREVTEWIRANGGLCSVVRENGVIERFSIKTLEGVMTVSPSDWIIRGVKGEFYPCKPAIFAATYEPEGAPDV